MRVWNEGENVDMVDDVLEFARTFCADQIRAHPSLPSEEIAALRYRLIDEEVNEELLPAMKANDVEGIADGLADSIVVIIGTAFAYGIPMKKVWEAVHTSNMAKRQPDGTVKRREDGKILKPVGWTPPDIVAILRKSM